MKAIALVVALLVSVSLTQNAPSPHTSFAVNFPQLGGGTGNNPTLVVLWATPSGWNADWSHSLNPSFNEFRDVSFSVNASWSSFTAGGGTYDFAIYTAGFPASSVNIANNCNSSNTNGCLARSLSISPSLHFAYTGLTPTVPKDDFTGPGQIEYFDEYHPTVGHGTITIYKDPDIARTGVVNIVDASALALAFDTSHGMTSFNAAADFNNDGKVDIMDASFFATLFDQSI